MEWSLTEPTLDASQRESPQMSCVEELLLLNRVQRDKRRNTRAERVYNKLFLLAQVPKTLLGVTHQRSMSHQATVSADT